MNRYVEYYDCGMKNTLIPRTARKIILQLLIKRENIAKIHETVYIYERYKCKQ